MNWIATAVVAFSMTAVASAATPRLLLRCAADNDLFRALQASGFSCERVDSDRVAVDRAAEGGAVMILADGYPDRTTVVEPATFEAAARKKLRLFVEYPATLPGMDVGAPRAARIERAVVQTDFFGPSLPRLRILAINDLHLVSAQVDSAHLVAARVAGFDTAVFGLPKSNAPLLFELPGGRALVATTKLSHFVTGRYAPQDAWQALWAGVLAWLCPDTKLPALTWTPAVRPSFGRDEPLPIDAEQRAADRGGEWFVRSKLLLHPSRAAEADRAAQGGGQVTSPPTDAPVGDGTLGILEAPLSVIRSDGSQMQSVARRGDCHAESAMALAFSAKLRGDIAKGTVARNLLNFYYFTSDARKRERADPGHGAYGLIAWGTSGNWLVANYGDDNARLLMGTMATAALLNETAWDEAMTMCLLANLRTTGRLGFRGDRIDIPELSRKGWKPYFTGSPVSYSPHMEAYLWACYLWAYRQTGYELFYARAENALRMTMAKYPKGWRWTNGLAQERARILLPLAWLVRVKDTPEHREWLRRAVDGLLELQDECGAIREELGPPGQGMFPPPASNEAYGRHEAPLIQRNGDPVCDLLYTVNFAFLGLHEAAAATGDARVRAAEDRLAQFLCRIQIRSETHPVLDGGWFRAFDYRRWEAWGSNADAGWGAWAIESGWTQGWIVSVLSMRRMETSLWDLTKKVDVASHFERLRRQMLPDDVVRSLQPARIDHAALGKLVVLATPADTRYPGGGPAGLVDGTLEVADHTATGWLGFEGVPFEATVDLGATAPVREVGVHFLQSLPVGIFAPAEVVVSGSDDGVVFRLLASATSSVPEREEGPVATMMRANIPGDVRVRYVRINVAGIGAIPDWHPAHGRKAWLFVDEIAVNPAAALRPD